MTLTTASGKTAQAVEHFANLKLGEHRGSPRVWLEGKRLVDVGFRHGLRYQLAETDQGLVLRLSPKGDRKVSGDARRPVVDLHTHRFGPAARVDVSFTSREIIVTVPRTELLAVERVRRLNARLQAGQPWRLGSCSHGAGVAADAILRGLGNAELTWATDISDDYIAQSLRQGPLSRGGKSIVSDIRDLDLDQLSEVDIVEGGLPCVAASRAGKSKKGLERPEDDPQVQDLAAAFIDVVRTVRPAVVVIENVPEYAQSDSAHELRRRLGRLGYTFVETVVDGAEWALEARQRLIMVAVSRGLDIDLATLLGSAERPATVGEILDRKVDRAAWRTYDHLAAKEARDAAKGSSFKQQLLTASSTRVPTIRRGYQKAGSTDPRLQHPTRPRFSRLLTPAEHARCKGIPPALVIGLSDKVAHEVLGQSVISPAFVALGQLVGAAAA